MVDIFSLYYQLPHKDLGKALPFPLRLTLQGKALPFPWRLTLPGKALPFSHWSEVLESLAWLTQVNNIHSLRTLFTLGFLSSILSMTVSHVLRPDDTSITGSDRARGHEVEGIESFIRE